MPKVIDTREQRAAELLKLVKTGPALSRSFDGSKFTPEQALYHYHLWADTWVLPLINQLVPELAKIEKAKIKAEREAEIKEFGGIKVGDHIIVKR